MADTSAKGSARRRFIAKSSIANGITIVSKATMSAWAPMPTDAGIAGDGARNSPARTTANATHSALDSTTNG